MSSVSAPVAAVRKQRKARLGLALRLVGVVAFIAILAIDGRALLTRTIYGAPGHYTVVVRSDADAGAVAAADARTHGFKIERVVTDGPMKGYVASMSSDTATKITSGNDISYIEMDSTVQLHKDRIETIKSWLHV